MECGSSADGTVPFVNFPVGFTGLFSVPVKLLFQSYNTLVMILSQLVLSLLALSNDFKNAHLTEKFDGSALGSLFLWEVWI